jgi:hypothetical protein
LVRQASRCSLRKSHVYAAGGVINRDYEGEISDFGDTVHITSLVDPTIGTYTAHTDITVEDIDDLDQILLINQSKYFAFEVDDIEKRQAKGEVMSQQAIAAAWKLRDVADKYVAGLMATGVAAGNVIAEQTVTKDTAYDVLVDLGTKLDEADVPTENRWAVITPKYHGLLLKDPRFIAAGDAQGASVRTTVLWARRLVSASASPTTSRTAPVPARASSSSLATAWRLRSLSRSPRLRLSAVSFASLTW